VLGPLVDLINFPGSDNPGDEPGLTMYFYPFLICFIGQVSARPSSSRAGPSAP
jgi:hypothetical protein